MRWAPAAHNLFWLHVFSGRGFEAVGRVWSLPKTHTNSNFNLIIQWGWWPLQKIRERHSFSWMIQAFIRIHSWACRIQYTCQAKFAPPHHQMLLCSIQTIQPYVAAQTTLFCHHLNLLSLSLLICEIEAIIVTSKIERSKGVTYQKWSIQGWYSTNIHQTFSFI